MENTGTEPRSNPSTGAGTASRKGGHKCPTCDRAINPEKLELIMLRKEVAEYNSR